MAEGAAAGRGGVERDTDVALVLTTVPDAEQGERLVSRLVEERLVACGNLVPGLTSIFRWEGDISRETELLVLLKARASRLEALFARVAELHPYEVPELLTLPVDAGSSAYCRWVREETEGVGA